MKRVMLLVGILACLHCGKHEPVPAEPAATEAPKPPDPNPAAPVVPGIASFIPANAPPEPPPPAPKPQPRAQALAGIGAYRSILQRRIAVGAQSDVECDARISADQPRLDAAKEKLGAYWLGRKTRYSSKPPANNGTVEWFVVTCLGCTSPGKDEPVPIACKQALVALDDLAAEVNAAK
jgi:hypothetical protein